VTEEAEQKGDVAKDVTDESKPQAPATETDAGRRATEDSAGLPPTDPHNGSAAGPGGTAPATRAPEAEVVGLRQGMFGSEGAGDTSGYGGLVRTVTMPAPSARPYGGYFDEVADLLAETLGDAGTEPAEAIESVVVDRGELQFNVRREHLVEVCRRLRDEPDLRFELLASVSGVHYPEDAGRELHSVYHLLSITHNRRVRLEVTAPDADPHVPSVVEVYPTADWHERETWDFFGIVYDGHPALTRIQMPDDWPGHPQRKDYPLGGIPVEYKGASIPPPDTRRSYS
jgi:NADH-quinone oxidoreductase subunit C